MENPFLGDPFREEDADVEDVEDTSVQNPYKIMEGYELEDASGAGIGEIEETVYDAVSDVLKYAVVEDLPLPSKTPPASSTGGCALTTRSPVREDTKGAFGSSLFVPFRTS